MGLGDILRRIRGHSPAGRTGATSRGLGHGSEDEADERARRAIEGHEEEIKEALRQGEEMREWIHNHRLRTRNGRLSAPARAYIDLHKRALEGWADEDLLEFERQLALGREAEIEAAFREGDEMRDWVRLHRR